MEQLITSGVEAVAVHGGLDQEDREFAIRSFKVRAYLGCAKNLFQILNAASYTK